MSCLRQFGLLEERRAGLLEADVLCLFRNLMRELEPFLLLPKLDRLLPHGLSVRLCSWKSMAELGLASLVV